MIAIDMEMPAKCDECRLCACEYSDDCNPEAYAYCCAKERFIAKTCDGTDKAICNAILGKPEWCPLKPVERVRVERIYPHEDVVQIPDERLRGFAMKEVAKGLGNYIVRRPRMCAVTCFPYSTDACDIVPDALADSVRMRAEGWVVEMKEDG